MFATSMLPFGALTLVMLPMTKEFGWSRTEFSYATTALMWSGSLSVLFFGKLSDRVGVRPVILWGTIAVGFLTLSVSWQTASIWQFYVYFGLFGVIAAAASPTRKSSPPCSRSIAARGWRFSAPNPRSSPPSCRR